MNLEFQYGARAASIHIGSDALVVALTNPALGAPAEHWALPKGNYKRHGDFHRIESDDYLLGAACVDVSPEALSETTEALYDQLLSEHPGFSLYRIWNFVPMINEQMEGQLENYQAFCLGRSSAFERHAQDALHSKMPAASAVGTQDRHLTLVYLAGQPYGRHLENPRQTPAYRYPEQYGPKPPAFARATSVDYDSRPTLFISGTASVLASASIGDSIESQLTTTLDNLRLIASQGPVAGDGRRRARVYLRHAEDYEYVKEQIKTRYLNEGDEAFYVQADICRRELLVEIEATIGL